MSQHVALSTDGPVARIALDRPAKKNALDRAMYVALSAALARAAADPAIRAVLITGGPDFCAGNDLADFRDATGGLDDSILRLMETVLGYDKPIVAAVDGLAIGIGTTLLLHCDIVVASSRARFRMPFVDLGLVPEFASSLALPRLAGLQAASDLLLTGRLFDAAEARALGLLAALVEPDALDATATRLAAAIAAKPAEAIRITRRLLRGDPADLLARAREEAALFGERLASPESRAAFEAFFARRK